MNTLVRSTTSTLGRRFDGYLPLAQKVEHGRSRRSLSKRRKEPHGMVTSLSYRRERAKQRGVFLKSYKLEMVDKLGPSRRRKLHKTVLKARAVVVSVASFLRIGSLRSCNSRSSICVSSPTAIKKFM
ncbi:hypothetical protein HS088_TW22G00072 [Tripterygium wilfordii]|uniref:Uncharacterized protein n=1 Tax=Tripterygium wilfordii TaxID=458696 RepID=A0A7J7BX00_TRIWF|nr:uncharacterized protein LOC119990959 [Tripterygium wilfordii]KAF5726394.1 hypothetical protein HS088_TW22G00072 [Tripterygium wilfordii]